MNTCKIIKLVLLLQYSIFFTILVNTATKIVYLKEDIQ